jgi:uncharacterized protein (TIGR00369 family)
LSVAAASDPVMSAEDLEAFFLEALPAHKSQTRVLEVSAGRALVAFDPSSRNLRPGNLVSGPTQMALADHAAYAVILAHIGPVAMAVTSNLNFSFLRAVQLRRLHAEARLLKLGRRLATVDVVLWQDTTDNIVAQSTVTYAIPG